MKNMSGQANLNILFVLEQFFDMAYHFISTVRDDQKDSFRLFAGKKCKFISLIGKTSLDTATHPYARMYEASYYLNIIANESYGGWNEVVKQLKEKAFKLNPNLQDYKEFERIDELDYYERMKDHPKFYD